MLLVSVHESKKSLRRGAQYEKLFVGFGQDYIFMKRKKETTQAVKNHSPQ